MLRIAHNPTPSYTIPACPHWPSCGWRAVMNRDGNRLGFVLERNIMPAEAWRHVQDRRRRDWLGRVDEAGDAAKRLDERQSLAAAFMERG